MDGWGLRIVPVYNNDLLAFFSHVKQVTSGVWGLRNIFSFVHLVIFFFFFYLSRSLCVLSRLPFSAYLSIEVGPR